MGEWIDIPAYRVLRLSKSEFDDGFECLDANGSVIHNGRHAEAALIVRKKDGKLFRVPRYHVLVENYGVMMYLEEVWK